MKHLQPPAATDPPVGLGLRAPHLDEVSRRRPAVAFFEVHPENYILDRAGLDKLGALRGDYRLSLHAVGLSLGSHDGIDAKHLAAICELADRLDPFAVSDHLSWSRVGEVYLNDLLPLPYTRATLDVFSRNVERVQAVLKRPILIENPSAYLKFRSNEFEEPEFLRLLVTRTGCGLLLDVNNVFVSASNLNFDAKNYLATFPFEAVGEIHLAGHQKKDVEGASILIDDHGSCVSAPVWSLYADAIARAPSAATLIEWDSNLPAFDILLEQRDRAASVARAALAHRRTPALETIQTKISNVLLEREPKDVELSFSGRLSVYRHNVRESLLSALRTVYAGVESLVGPAFFRHAALQFIEANPPTAPSLAAYGEEFPRFLGGLSSCRTLPYLEDVAQFEWNASRASLHTPKPPIPGDEVQRRIADDPARLCFVPQSGVSHVSSAYPVDEISNFARAGGEGAAPALDVAVFLEIVPGPQAVVIRRFEESEFKFRRALCAGLDIGTAAEAALDADPLFVLFAAIRAVLEDELFIDCRTGQSPCEETRPCPC